MFLLGSWRPYININLDTTLLELKEEAEIISIATSIDIRNNLVNLRFPLIFFLLGRPVRNQ